MKLRVLPSTNLPNLELAVSCALRLADTATPDPLLRQMEKHETRRLELFSGIADREEAVREAGKVQMLTNCATKGFARRYRLQEFPPA